jgi:iron complex outermembrane receptor protein/hemoglobin/transferrin/lactoferrin receptor protein
MDERQARSTPEALRYEPGVFLQQSAHGQASAYVRGRTGQQTVILFDGIRLNNSSWRQGPNQYLFTVDPRTLQGIEVLRGGASTRFGSDALGGVIALTPLDVLERSDRDRAVHPRAFVRFGSADDEVASRVQADASLGDDTGVLVGFSARRTGLLRAGRGSVDGLASGTPALVPVVLDDGRTQLGTGFGEVTADARVAHRIGDDQRLVAAAYLHRLYDVPRTDQCPAPYAARDECLRIDEQFRTLAYVTHEIRGSVLGDRARTTLSYQRQHERRTLERPGSFVSNTGRDAVDTLGVTFEATSRAAPVGSEGRARLTYGADAYVDTLASRAWIGFEDIGFVRELTRGQYIDGSRYAQGGVYAQGELALGAFVASAGARIGVARAQAPSDPASSTRSVDDAWAPLAAHVAARWRASESLTLLATVDRSFRAPNLDDLTARQQSGPGFLFENAGLRAETAYGAELGARYDSGGAVVEAWGFASRTYDGITRALRDIADCPPNTPGCIASWSRYQLVNTPGAARLDGAELTFRVRVAERWLLRGNASYAFGEGPNPQAPTPVPSARHAATVPLSRVPPFNGTVELRVTLPRHAYVGAGVRWALAQDRLAPTDYSDARIPIGGTPGFFLVDLRAGLRVPGALALYAALENVGDAAYRHHGSAILGPGRSLLLGAEFGW